MTAYEDILFLDTETTGVKLFSGDKIFGISYAMGDQQPKYVDIRRDSTADFKEKLDRAKLIVAHNTKFDAHSLHTMGIDIAQRKLDCTMIRAQLIYNNDTNYQKFDLATLTGEKDDIIDDLAEHFGGKATRNIQMGNLHAAPYEMVSKYAIQDVVAMRGLYNSQVGHLPHAHYMEQDVLSALIRTERLGMRIDTSKIDSTVHAVKLKIAKAQATINDLVGREINVNSSPQMQELFEPVEQIDGTFKLIDGTIAQRTKAGKASIDQDTLGYMTHPAAELVLKIRKYAKIHDTFLISQLQGHSVNGRVHPWFNQCRVVTGRLSCNSPNMQAIPKRDPEMKALLRPLFLPEDGHTLLRCDYEQSDIRGFAHYLTQMYEKDDHPVLHAYRRDSLTDFHQMVSDMLGIPRNPGVGGGANAKQINLAMVFNMGMGRLAKEMGMPYRVEKKGSREYLKPGPEAKAVFKKYHTAIPGAYDLQDKASAMALKNGYVPSILGRRLRFPDHRFSYKASGYLYQSFTADLIKKAMVDTIDIAKLHLSVHDELIFSIDDEQQVKDIVEAMEQALSEQTDIPIRTVPEVGQNWGNTEAYND